MGGGENLKLLEKCPRQLVSKVCYPFYFVNLRLYTSRNFILREFMRWHEQDVLINRLARVAAQEV